MSEGLILLHKAQNLLENVEALQIRDAKDYKQADEFISQSVAGEKEIKAFYKDQKAEAQAALNAIREKEKEPLSCFKEVVRIITGKMSEYRAEHERIEAERREAEEAKAREDASLQALELAEEGVPQEVIDQVVENISRPVELAPAQELRSKTTFKADYIVEFIPGQERLIPLDILIPTTKTHKDAVLTKARKMAAMTGGADIPGLRVIQVESARRRSA